MIWVLLACLDVEFLNHSWFSWKKVMFIVPLLCRRCGKVAWFLVFLLNLTWCFCLDNQWEFFLCLCDFLSLLEYLPDIHFIILCQFFMAYVMFFKAVDSSFFYSCQFFLNFLIISVLLYCRSSSGKSVAYLLSLRCH